MKYNVRENLSETSGTISNLHGFLHRFNDTGFKNKWTGYWAPPYKFLDYYGIKINGIWLGPDTLEATEYGEKFVFHHEMDCLHVKEVVSTPEKLPGFKIEIELENHTENPKAIQAQLEPGVDIREKSQDLGPENYDTEEADHRITVSAGKKLAIRSEDEFELRGEEEVRTHYPGEKQRCFIPGRIVFRKEIDDKDTEKIEIEFETSEASFDSIEPKEPLLEDEKLGRCYSYSIKSLENLIYDRNGRGIIAGHPWFQSYWARDSFWSLLGLIDAGYFEEAEKILENFAENDFATKIGLNGEIDKNPREDTYPLFIIAADKLEKHSDADFKEAKEDAFDHLELGGEGVVKHSPEATWMDTLERAPAVDIQSLWLEAAKILGKEKQQKALKNGLEKFKDGEFMKDYLGEDAPRTVNVSIPLMFRHTKDQKILETLNGEFCSRYGARTRSMTDPGYDAGGYHTGSVWGLTTCWAAAANLENGNFRQGRNMLETLTQFLDRNQLGALPEAVNAETGNLMGAPEQAWSAGLFVHVIDSYLLGIKPKENCVEIDPSGDVTCVRKNKRIKGEEVDIKFMDGEAEVLTDTDLDFRL